MGSAAAPALPVPTHSTAAEGSQTAPLTAQTHLLGRPSRGLQSWTLHFLSAPFHKMQVFPGPPGKTGYCWSLIHVQGTQLKSHGASGCHLAPTEAFSEDGVVQDLSGRISLTLAVQCHAYCRMLGSMVSPTESLVPVTLFEALWVL